MKKSMFLFMIAFFFVTKGNSQTNEGVIIDKRPVDATKTYYTIDGEFHFIVKDLHTGNYRKDGCNK